MQLFTSAKSQLASLREQPFKLEKDMQTLFERNLEAITGFKFVKSEFVVKAQRFDTLAFDVESRSFVIIEYKRERNFSVIDQGVSYLNLMLENKAEFIVEYNESQKSGLKMWINLKQGALDDPKGVARDVSSVGHWGNGDYEIIVQDTKNLEYIMSLVKQAI